MEGNRANVIASDGGRVTVSLKQTAIDTQFVEFEGTVEAPNQLRETDRAYFGGNFGKLCTTFFYIKFGLCGFLHVLKSRVQSTKIWRSGFVQGAGIDECWFVVQI